MANVNVYDAVTDRIIAQLEAGQIPWRKAWRVSGSSQLPSNYITGKPYRGINIWLLVPAGFNDSRWLTYKQAQDIGAQVRKGEKGTPIVFWSLWSKPAAGATTGPAESEDAERIPFARQYTVFNVEQCDGIPVELPFEVPTFEPIPAAQQLAESYLKRASIELRHGGGRAYYNPRLDFIQMPAPEAFTTPEAYYATLFHEQGHSTGHDSRLARDFKGATTFGDCDYSKEELVAEFTAAYLCAETGISNEQLETNSAAYLQGWLRALKNDKKMLVSTAQKAQRAADFILNRSTVETISQPETIAA